MAIWARREPKAPITLLQQNSMHEPVDPGTQTFQLHAPCSPIVFTNIKTSISGVISISVGASVIVLNPGDTQTYSGAKTNSFTARTTVNYKYATLEVLGTE